jgi:putative addiction module component (TIGR02574 family)
MSSNEILPAALALSAKERAKLARNLLESLHEADEGDLDAAWLEEIDRRAEEVERGTAKLVDWESARNEIAQRLKARR